MRRLLPLLAVALGCVFATDAGAADGQYWCGTHAPPCIESATRDGAAIGPGDPTFDVGVTGFTGDGSHSALWDVTRPGADDPFELGAAERSVRWTVTIDMGATIPRVVFQYGGDLAVTRATGPGGAHRITIASNPVTLENNDECNVSTFPWTCPFRASSERKGTLQGQVTDYDAWDDVPQRESFLGMNYSTNIAVTSLPPEIEADPATGAQRLLLRLANQHERPSGEVFRGFVHLRIPNRFLRLVYGVDDPSALTTSGLTTSGGGGGTASVTQEAGDDAMLVDVTGITFSQRLLRIRRGKIVPTKPTRLRAERTGRHGARIFFKRSRSRGSKVTSYAVKCRGDNASAEGSATKPPVRLTQLEEGVSYRCRVRPRSKAGQGPSSKRVTVPAKPDQSAR
ncbi:MAG TPA: fibronectin type III domain-containing protein [Thermoleophilaceae bacterium]|nr:fibronectin type III domain-containing protein [Thermoleophilaceae bacterium]